MIRGLAISLIVAFALIALGVSEHSIRTHAKAIEGATFHRVDYPLCVTVQNAPLLRSPRDRATLIIGKRYNDKGFS